MAIGPRGTYSDANIKPESLNDLIHFIDWNEAPLLKEFGLDNQNGKFRFERWPVTKYEWLEDTMAPVTGTLAEEAAGGETAIDLASGNGDYLKEGDVIKVEDELMYVSSVATDTITVIRGFGGTTDVTHATSLAWNYQFPARLEGADYDTGYTTTTTRAYNHTQIFSEAVKVTGSEAVHDEYGIDDQMAYHVAKLIGGGAGLGAKGKAGKLSIALQKTFYNGQRAAGSSSTSRAMGGFEYFVTTNVTDKNSTALELKDIEDLMSTIYLAGGTPDMLICNTWVRRKINEWFKGSIRTERTETTGGSVINTIDTGFAGSIEVMFDRWCPTDRVYLVEKDKLGWVSFRPWDIYDRPSTGDYMVKEVLGEFGFVLVNQLAHGYIKEISTTL
jgi:hypothetical protein